MLDYVAFTVKSLERDKGVSHLTVYRRLEATRQARHLGDDRFEVLVGKNWKRAYVSPTFPHRLIVNS